MVRFRVDDALPAPGTTDAGENTQLAPVGSPLHVVCWTQADGLYSCGCNHESINAAMGCLIPDGRSFIRTVQNGVTRSLDDAELREFLAVLTMRFAALGTLGKEPGVAL